MMTSSIWEAATPESAIAALMATDPSWGAVTVANAPWKAPTGVRRAAKITTGSEFMRLFRIWLGMPSITAWSAAKTVTLRLAPRSRRQGLADGSRNQLAAALSGVARGENFKYFNANGRPAHAHAPRGQNRASAVNGDGHDGHVGACRRGKCAAQ